MTYAFDPEIAPSAAMLPEGSLADVEAARQTIEREDVDVAKLAAWQRMAQAT